MTNALAVADEMKDYSEQFRELQKAQPTTAAADIQAPIVIEDLETGDASMHQGGVTEPPQEGADQEAYFQAVTGLIKHIENKKNPMVRNHVGSLLPGPRMLQLLPQISPRGRAGRATRNRADPSRGANEGESCGVQVSGSR